MTTTDRDWAEKIGKPCFENLAEMVAALECDYDRLQELRDARDSFTFDEDSNLTSSGHGQTSRPETTNRRKP